MNKAIKTGLIATILVYALGVAYTYISNERFKQQFEQFDINKNGSIDNNEITKESEVFVSEMAKRKTTGQAIVMLIPAAILIGFISFAIAILVKKVKTINKNEINYN